MDDDELFDELDLDGDGVISRQELHWAACQFGWGWQQAPVYALLDFLTIRGPLGKDAFHSSMAQIARDPDGAYGQVLRLGPLPAPDCSGTVHETKPVSGSETGAARVVGRLEDILAEQVTGDFTAALKLLGIARHAVRSDETALLIIDPQRSFTSGAWMQSMGASGEHEVLPIRLAFDNCACLLRAIYRCAEVMFTRCPFPPESYDWDERLAGIMDPAQFYFIKPSNNALMPRTNGYREWVQSLIRRGKKTLVIGGCTLNSCLRVSAIETRRCFQDEGLDVVVDLSLSGARTSNYLKSPVFGGMSAVEFAIREMSDAGVTIAELVEWL